MKLLLRRDQRSAMLGNKPVFMLDVRAEISAEERAKIKKYGLGKVLLYEKKPLAEGKNEYSQLAHTIMWRTLNLLITVDDLTNGKRIECKEITEMLGAEQQVREAAETFKAILDAASQFGGEEVVEL